MKKYLFLFLPLMLAFLIPANVSAKTKCEVVSGTGENVGDEIACGTEHFYVLENDGENIKMFAKYNLKIKNGRTQVLSRDARNGSAECANQLRNDGGTSESYTRYDSNLRMYLCDYYFNSAESDKIVQDTATSPRIKEVNGYKYEYYDYSTFLNMYYFERGIAIPNYSEEAFVDISAKQVSDSTVTPSLKEYKQNLSAAGFDIKDINLLTLDDLSKIAKSVSGNAFPYSDWKAEDDRLVSNVSNRSCLNGRQFDSTYHTLSDPSSNNYQLSQYPWLYDSNYWLGTRFTGKIKTASQWYNSCPSMVGFENKKLVLMTEQSAASYHPTIFALGVRPTVTISAKTMGGIPDKEDGQPEEEVKEQACKVISGNGSGIGDEIACGSEHFYVVSSNDKETKLLAKYSLSVGSTVHKEKIEREEGDNRSDGQYCYELATSRNGEAGATIDEGYCYYITKSDYGMDRRVKINKKDDDKRPDSVFCVDMGFMNDWMLYTQTSSYTGTYTGSDGNCHFMGEADYSTVHQDEEAKSAHTDEDGNYLYPQKNDVYPILASGGYYGQPFTGLPLDFKTNQGNISNQFKNEKYDNYFGDVEPNISEMINTAASTYNQGSPAPYMNELGGSLYLYGQNLNHQGVAYKNMGLLSLDDLNNIAKKRGNSIPYKEWYERGQTMLPENISTVGKITFGDIKSKLSEEDSWIYDRSYWLSTGYTMTNENGTGGMGLLFVTDTGEVCGGGAMAVNAPGCNTIIRVIIGSGVRPVITIDNKNIEYKITTKTDGNGTIEAKRSARGGEMVKFKVIAKRGYKLKALTLKADDGTKVTFEEEDFTEDENGEILINNNKFEMPFDNVTIEASWEKYEEDAPKNPNTSNAGPVVYCMLAGALFAGVALTVRRIAKTVK